MSLYNTLLTTNQLDKVFIFKITTNIEKTYLLKWMDRYSHQILMLLVLHFTQFEVETSSNIVKNNYWLIINLTLFPTAIFFRGSHGGEVESTLPMENPLWSVWA